MARHSQTEQSMDFHELIEGQVRECYGRVVYSHKTHEKCADILLGRLGTIKLCQIVLSSITTAGFIATILGAGPVGAVVGWSLGIVGAVWSASAICFTSATCSIFLDHRHLQIGTTFCS